MSRVVPFLSSNLVPSSGEDRSWAHRLFQWIGRWLALLVVFSPGCDKDPEATEAPESGGIRGVVFLMLDTVRADHLSAYGYPKKTTPSLDAMAAKGTIFENAHASAPWTIPSVASLFTGHQPSSHKAGAISEPGEPRQLKTSGDDSNFRGFDRSVPTWISALRDEVGLKTFGFFANPLVQSQSCYTQGFDEVAGGFHPADKVVDWAIDQIPELEDDSFFMYLHFMDAHQPLRPPDDLLRKFLPEDYPGRDVDGRKFALLKKSVREWGGFGHARGMERPEFELFRQAKTAAYDASLAYMDQEIARFLKALKKVGLDERNVLFVVTADHGEELWDHAEIAQEAYNIRAMGRLGIGHGHTLFQEQLRVPLFFTGPQISSGERVDGPVSLIDVGRTILDLNGLSQEEAPVGLSQSLTPYLQGSPDDKGRLCFAEGIAYGYELKAMINPDGVKYIQSAGGNQNDLAFDLVRDPLETVDLLKSDTFEKVPFQEKITQAVEAFEGIDLAVGSNVNLDLDVLKGLGYVKGEGESEDSEESSPDENLEKDENEDEEGDDHQEDDSSSP